jgi:hypothetical protein
MEKGFNGQTTIRRRLGSRLKSGQEQIENKYYFQANTKKASQR